MTDETNDTEKKKEDWMNAKWRPMMGWMYMVVCAFDFVIAPILWSLLNTLTHGSTAQWNPLTLQGAGLFHISMGAVLGIAALGRTQEKLAGANNGGLTLPSLGSNTMAQPISNTQNPFGNTASTMNMNPFNNTTSVTSNQFQTPNTGFAVSTPIADVTINANGKKVIPMAPDPII